MDSTIDWLHALQLVKQAVSLRWKRCTTLLFITHEMVFCWWHSVISHIGVLGLLLMITESNAAHHLLTSYPLFFFFFLCRIHFKGAWCLHLVCIWKDISFYSHACIVSGRMGRMARRRLTYVLLEELWSCLTLKWKKKRNSRMLDITVWCGLVIESHCESCCIFKGHRQGFPPCTNCHLLPSDWLAAEINKKKKNHPKAKQKYFHWLSTDKATQMMSHMCNHARFDFLILAVLFYPL